ncbi:MAG: acylneuraminate cytidylyltransferase family protein [Anaerolineales bacterium]|nr:acylneuraminate cytidylyltransferase family protein [Anaerolineales bacterium]
MGFDILGIIPARGGSKGIPRKNVRQVGGRPLIAWTWEAAQVTPTVTRLIVSTDDQEIAGLARAAGIEIPFIRPAQFASDTASAIDVVSHALNWLQEQEQYRPDFVLWLQPTSPLRTSADIEAAATLAQEKAADSVISVCPVEHQHPALMKRVESNGLLKSWQDDQTLIQRRQELPPVYCLNGAIYLIRREVLLEQQTFYPEATFAYVMPSERSLDIDTPWDLYLVDLILKDRCKHELD